MKAKLALALAVGMVGLGSSFALAAGSATYNFNNTLAADELGVPALVSVDPLGQNGFETAEVFGVSRPVFKWDGTASPVNLQAGLTLDTTGIVTDPTAYSLELVFEFTQDTGSWRRIFDTTGRKADTGFYVEPGDRLQVYNDVTGKTNFVTNEFHYIVMTVENINVKAYFDGVLELNSETNKLNIQDPVVSFFIDNNLGGPAETEFADGRVALIRLQDGVLSDSEIADRADDPFVQPPPPPPPPPPPAIPLPAAALMFIPAAGMALWLGKRLRAREG
ncbi:MAG: hypothetical protein IT446_15950 [Phycisphaerales bacterium]|nr:hypothetical protein [Phycisphaerales bacterium]